MVREVENQNFPQEEEPGWEANGKLGKREQEWDGWGKASKTDVKSWMKE